MESPDLEKTIIWEDDPENPINWPDRRKWLVTLVACFTAFVVGWNALSISSAATVINERFGISDAHFPNSFWTVTSWNVGAGLFPLAGLPVLEDFGFRKGYLVNITSSFRIRRHADNGHCRYHTHYSPYL